MSRYDVVGRSYARTRQPDPRIAARIADALCGMGTVANIGAGTGSYETADTVVAVEPSAVMIGQRPPAAAPAVRAVAEALPLGSGSVDAALACLTVHHWSDPAAGIAELLRIARRRIVVLTWDHEVTADFWLLDYLPAARATDAALAVPMAELTALLPGCTVTPVPVPHDCLDGFAAAFWRRPHAYLDPVVRAGMSMFTHTAGSIDDGLRRLAADLDDGTWASRHAELLELDELDAGYRLLVVDL